MRGPPRRSRRAMARAGAARRAGARSRPERERARWTARSRVPVGTVEPEHDQRAVGIDTAGEAHRRVVAQGRGQQLGRRRGRRRRRRPAHGALDERGRGGVGLHEELDAELGVVVRHGAPARGMRRVVVAAWCRREQPLDGRVGGIRLGTVHVCPRHLRHEPRRRIGLGESELPGEAGHGHLAGDPGHVEVGGRRARDQGPGARGRIRLEPPVVEQAEEAMQVRTSAFVRRLRSRTARRASGSDPSGALRRPKPRAR